MEYHQIKKIIIAIDCTIRSHGLAIEKVEMVQLPSAYTDHLQTLNHVRIVY